MEAAETTEVDTPVLRCDGGDGPLGHPAIYLNMGDSGHVDCPYCGRRFVLKEGAARAAH